ncbi:MAG: alanine racemase [Desulfobacterales bacterium]|nr:alanine racemase [Desulfobacterales bacterium]
MKEDRDREYLRYKKIFEGTRFPFAFVDLDRFDRNVAYVAATQAKTGKRVRIHSKSIRCAPLIQRILEKGGAIYQGIMTISVEETACLAGLGLDDFIVAYPTVQPSDMQLLVDLAREGKKVSLMVDCEAHLKILSNAGLEAGVVLGACMEIDMAYRPLKSPLHLGVRRSPIRSPDEAVSVARASMQYPGVKIDAIMGYEGHIAGPNDAVPGQWLKNKVMRGLKAASVRELTRRRGAVVAALGNAGLDLAVVNGGGSGSLVSTGKDPSVTEVTAGSAFFAPGLFRHYQEVAFEPAAFFAVQVVRKPATDMVTCQGGGYVASGSAGTDKLPVPVFPRGMKLLPLEGAGEVQTPLLLPGDCPPLELGDPVFFQHAKGGELAERFNEFYLVSGDRIVDTVKTYRGDGHAFI